MPIENQKPTNGEQYRSLQQQPIDKQHHQATRLVSTYTTTSGSYETNQLDKDEPYNPGSRRQSSGASSLAHFISHAFARGAKTNYLFAYLLIANLLMAILNTTLLSFVVRSVQLNQLAHMGASGSKSLGWDEHLEGVVLELPTILASPKSSLSVGSIEAQENKPLKIQSFSSMHNRKQDDDSQILISTRNQEDRLIDWQTRNHIVIDSKYFDSSERKTDHDKDNQQPRRPVEIVTNNLILNTIVADTTKSSEANQKSTTTTTTTTPKSMTIKRALEFSSEQQSIVLPLIDRLELYPPHANGLLIGKSMRVRNAEIRGTTSDDFDIQTHRGNLTCEAPSGSLRVVSKSAKLNVNSAKSLELNAPELKLNAAKIYLADGIEFFDEKPVEENSKANGKGKLSAYKLVLIDGKLMAAKDSH